MSGFAQPTGYPGMMLARGMVWGHRDFYNNTARVLIPGGRLAVEMAYNKDDILCQKG